MAISRINNNCLIYPTGVYRMYNLYLIDEYKKFHDFIDTLHINSENKINGKSFCNTLISDLEKLLEKSTSKNVEDIFSTMDWEDKLEYYYSVLDTEYNRYSKDKLKTISIFLRREKLKEIENGNR